MTNKCYIQKFSWKIVEIFTNQKKNKIKLLILDYFFGKISTGSAISSLNVKKIKKQKEKNKKMIGIPKGAF